MQFGPRVSACSWQVPLTTICVGSSEGDGPVLLAILESSAAYPWRMDWAIASSWLLVNFWVPLKLAYLSSHFFEINSWTVPFATLLVLTKFSRTLPKYSLEFAKPYLEKARSGLPRSSSIMRSSSKLQTPSSRKLKPV